jgi:hypothetical protein
MKIFIKTSIFFLIRISNYANLKFKKMNLHLTGNPVLSIIWIAAFAGMTEAIRDFQNPVRREWQC